MSQYHLVQSMHICQALRLVLVAGDSVGEDDW